MTPVPRHDPPGRRRWLAAAAGSLRLTGGTLVGRFATLAFLTLTVIGVVLGWLLTTSLTQDMLSRETRVTGRIVADAVSRQFTAEDFLAPDPAGRYEFLSETMAHLSLGPNIVRAKVWDSRGTVIWSDDRELVGLRFADNEDLDRALSGEISSEISLLTKDEQALEHDFKRLLELYVPVRFAGDDDIAVVFEIYKDIDSLYADIAQHNLRMWVSIGLGFTVLFVVLYGIVRDASKRIDRQAAEIGQSEERYRSLLHSAQDGIVTVDREGRILLFNRGAETIFGYESNETIGQSLQILMPPEYREKHRAGLTGFFAADRGEVVGTAVALEGVRKNGERFDLELSLNVSGEGEDKLVTGILRDVSERIRMGKQLEHSQLLASVGTTTAGIAHEVNNPLSAIILYSELVDQAGLPARARRDLKVIRSEAKRAAGIMKELLAYSRKAEPVTRRLDVNRTLRKVLKMRQYQEHVRNVAVAADLTSAALRVHGDAGQLTQVFMNLIVNAEGALDEASDKRIVVTSEVAGKWARISIADNGTGIPEEHLTQVFFPFFSTKAAGKGTGLGLSTCYGIVTAHKGRIHAENNRMGGATFIVELPLATADRRPPRN